MAQQQFQAPLIAPPTAPGSTELRPRDTRTPSAAAAGGRMFINPAERFGPVVLRRYGGGAEIFHWDPGHGWAPMVLMGGWFTAGMLLAELVDGGRAWQGVLAMASAAGVLAIRSSCWRWRPRRFSRLPVRDRLGDLPPGTPVHIAGTVEADGTVCRAPGSDAPVVYARDRYWQADVEDRASPVACEEIRGMPFRVRLADGLTVRVLPGEISLADQPSSLAVGEAVRRALGAAVRGQRLRKPCFFENTLAPGDRIEAVGRLGTEVVPSGQSAPARGVPLLYTLRPIDRRGVRVRRLVE